MYFANFMKNYINVLLTDTKKNVLFVKYNFKELILFPYITAKIKDMNKIHAYLLISNLHSLMLYFISNDSLFFHKNKILSKIITFFKKVIY